MRGYDPEQVDAAIASRDARLARLEREASRLAERVVERERRLQQALRRGGDPGGEDAGSRGGAPARAARGNGSIRGVTGMVGEVRAQARREAARIRARARRDAVQIAERLAELASVREELDRVLDALGIESAAGRRVQPDVPPPRVGTREGEPPPADGVYEGEVEVEIGPLDDFAQLTGFEDAAAAIGGASEIRVKRFSGGRARLGMSLDQPVELLRELEERSPLEFRVRALRGRELFLDVAGG